MTVKLSVFGVAQTISFLKKKNKSIEKREIKGITNAAFFLQNEVKSSIAGQRAEPTSVDTGRFLNSVQTKIMKANAAVFSDVPYAKDLEFGSAGRQARPHFRNSKSRNQDKIKEIIKVEVQKA